MLVQLFPDLLLSVFLLLLGIYTWSLYYIQINIITTPAIQASDIKKHKLINLTGSMRITVLGVMLLGGILLNYNYIYNLNTFTILWSMIHASHNTLNYFYLVILVFVIIVFCGLSLFNQNITFSGEYLLFILLIIVGSYLLISSTNLFLTIFLLEFIALLIFGKLAISKILYRKNSTQTLTRNNTHTFSYSLFNALFFQFWANFISTICLFFSLLNIHYMFGASNFFIINFLFYLISTTWYYISMFASVTLIILISGFFIKLGLSPYQFFKIETYKGIPLFIIVIYTSLYFVSYIYFFLFLCVYQLPAVRVFGSTYMMLALICSVLYLISLLFDTKNFKAFLSYSTLITVSNIFFIILLI